MERATATAASNEPTPMKQTAQELPNERSVEGSLPISCHATLNVFDLNQTSVSDNKVPPLKPKKKGAAKLGTGSMSRKLLPLPLLSLRNRHNCLKLGTSWRLGLAHQNTSTSSSQPL